MDQELFSGDGWTITREEAVLPNGVVARAARARTFDTAYLIGVNGDRKILLLREYRPFFAKYIWKLPTGKIKAGEDPDVTAQRVLREETGFEAGLLTLLWSGQGTERLRAIDYFFLAEQLEASPLPPDEDELMEIHFLPIEQAVDTLLRSDIVHTPSAYALMRFERSRNADH
ncbi:MAG: NUDIX hydrolase [Candidatus Peribacteraceae bacterium]|nr:NUDIX hydrolase [Candidatus Peribacteraceae bacterium]